MLNLCLCPRFKRTDPKKKSGKLLSDAGLFSSYGSPRRERRTGKFPGGFFKDAQGFEQLDADSQASLTSSRSLPP